MSIIGKGWANLILFLPGTPSLLGIIVNFRIFQSDNAMALLSVRKGHNITQRLCK